MGRFARVCQGVPRFSVVDWEMEAAPGVSGEARQEPVCGEFR